MDGVLITSTTVLMFHLNSSTSSGPNFFAAVSVAAIIPTVDMCTSGMNIGTYENKIEEVLTPGSYTKLKRIQ